MLKWEDEGMVGKLSQEVRHVFKVGDRVETKYVWFFRWFTRRGTVTACSEDSCGGARQVIGEDDGICARWPVYTVRLDCDGEERRFKQNQMSF